jgi:hypothetical protein
VALPARGLKWLSLKALENIREKTGTNLLPPQVFILRRGKYVAHARGYVSAMEETSWRLFDTMHWL